METTVGDVVKFYEKYPAMRGKLSVKTRFGYKIIEGAALTAKHSQVLKFKVDSGNQIKVSPDHLMLSNNCEWKPSKTLTVGDFLFTENGPVKITSIKMLKSKEDLFDLQVAEVKEFFANGLVSHNSTFIDAITFALYGKPFRKINKGQLINSINKSELVTEIEFSIGPNKYKIIRGIKPNIFEVYCNNVLVKQDAKVKDYQEQLERYILKMNYKSFTQVVILGSARYTPFMQLSASDRRSVIEDLLDIQIFSNMNSIVKDKLSGIKDSVQDCKYKIELFKDKIELQKQNIKQNKKASDELVLRKREIISNTAIEVEDLQQSIQKLLEENESLSEQITDLSSLEKKQKKLADIGVKLKSNISKIEKENEFYHDNDNCPTCKQTINHIFKTQIVSSNTEKMKELKCGEQKLIEDYRTVQKRLTEIKEVNEKILNNNSIILDKNSNIKSAQKYIKLVSAEIDTIKDSTDAKETGHDTLQELIESLDVYVEQYEEYINEKSYYDFISIMLKDGGIKTRIIKQYLPILNKYINQYLTQLDFFVNFNINENFEEVIKSRHRDEFTYANFSEGEKTRLDLAILFSFRQLARLKNSVNTNLLILDEIMDGSLDTGGTDVFMNLLSTVDKHTNIFVISHKSDQVSDKFDSILKFEKVKNFSKMKVIQ
jgi:DNA repair exonuclease SbcCD ATPase subunit